MTPSERGRIVWRIGDLILEHVDELAQLESLDNGKPFLVAQAADVPLAAGLFHYMAGWATKIEANTINISLPYMPGANFHSESSTVRRPGCQLTRPPMLSAGRNGLPGHDRAVEGQKLAGRAVVR